MIINAINIHQMMMMFILVICITIEILAICSMRKIKKRIIQFKGYVVDDQYSKHYECPACRTRIDILNDNSCKNCGQNLFQD